MTVTVFNDCVVTVPKSRRLGFSEDVDKTRPQKQNKASKTRQCLENKTRPQKQGLKNKTRPQKQSKTRQGYKNKTRPRKLDRTTKTKQTKRRKQKTIHNQAAHAADTTWTKVRTLPLTTEKESRTSGVQEKPQQRTVNH